MKLKSKDLPCTCIEFPSELHDNLTSRHLFLNNLEFFCSSKLFIRYNSSRIPNLLFLLLGRLVLRSALTNPNVKVVAFNDPFLTLDYAVYLFKYDSVHGLYPGTVEGKDGNLIIDGVAIKFFTEKKPSEIPWGSAGAHYVCESTGVFCTKETAGQHLGGGAKKVIISAPAKDGKL